VFLVDSEPFDDRCLGSQFGDDEDEYGAGDHPLESSRFIQIIGDMLFG
jgi:hypothetical protein